MKIILDGKENLEELFAEIGKNLAEKRKEGKDLVLRDIVQIPVFEIIGKTIQDKLNIFYRIFYVNCPDDT